MEHNRESRNKPTHSKSVNLQIWKQEHKMEERQCDTGITENRHEINSVRKFSHMMYKNKIG